jgi:uncharacterized protein YjbI with pentapeptide repeats
MGLKPVLLGQLWIKIEMVEIPKVDDSENLVKHRSENQRILNPRKSIICFNQSDRGETMMKRYSIAATLLVAPLLWAGPALANNPEQVKQLLSTGQCFQCDLSGADLTGAHLIGADLREANLRGANLSHVNLEGADLTGANLTGANLTAAFLTNASLNEADLDRVNLTAAIINTADVSGASMEDMIITDAKIYNTQIGVGGSYDQ